MTRPYLKLFKTIGQLRVWLVDGAYIRNHIDTDFIGGGHALVYRFIPRKEIWIEKMRQPAEHQYLLLHELCEHRLMVQKKLSYLVAHRRANTAEAYYRRHSSELRQRLTREALRAVAGK